MAQISAADDEAEGDISRALRPFRQLARNNRLANRRLLAACAQLRQGEFEAKRTSFFPSIKATLNHIITIDWFYLDALEGGTLGEAAWDPEEPFASVHELAMAQAASDERLLVLVGALTEAGLSRPTLLHRATGVEVERTDDVLMHLFLHQTHHRGQAHAMLSGTSVAPPQLDEFILKGDRQRRSTELSALGWTEE